MEDKNRLASGALTLAALVPATICLIVSAPMLWVIWPDLTGEQMESLVLQLLVTLGFALVVGLVSGWIWLRRMQVPISLLIITPPLQFALFYGHSRWLNVPPSQGWMFDEDTFMTLILSGIIPLFYTSLMLLARQFAIRDRRSLLISVAGSIGIPVGIYALFQPLRFARGSPGTDTLLIVLLASLTIGFSFLIIRLLYFVVRRRAGWALREVASHSVSFSWVSFR